MSERMINSTSDDRVANNSMRQQYRRLEDHEKEAIDGIKTLGAEFEAALDDCLTFVGPYALRELGIARNKIEEAVMWAVKGITK